MKQRLEKIKIFLIENYKWIILFICIVSLLVLIEDVMDNDIMTFDEKGYFIISKYLTKILFNLISRGTKTVLCDFSHYTGNVQQITIKILF